MTKRKQADDKRRNSALYVSSRILFFLARNSGFKKIRDTIGRTNNGHTPLAAILVSFVPGLLAFLVARASTTAFVEVVIPLPPLSFSTLTVRKASWCFWSPLYRSITMYLCKRMCGLHPLPARVGVKYEQTVYE